MGRPVSSPPRSIARVKLPFLNFRKIAQLAQTVHDALLTNIAFYVTPLPTLVNFQTDIDALSAAIQALGTKTNKGPAAALVACRDAATIVAADLTQLRAYVMQTVINNSPDPVVQASNIALSGFAVKSKKSKIDKMQKVRNLRQVSSKKYPFQMGIVRWKKPTGLFTGAKAPAYNIYAGGTYLATTTATFFQLPTVGSMQIQVACVSGSGEGQKAWIQATRTL